MDYRLHLIELIPMQVRPNGDSPAEQLVKFKHHKEANETLSLYIKRREYLSAYTVAFSQLEDRLRAMAIVKQRDLLGGKNYEMYVTLGLARVISFNYEKTDENSVLIQNLKTITINRNKLLHEAMWRTNAISLTDITHVMKLRDIVANDLSKLKRQITRNKKILTA